MRIGWREYLKRRLKRSTKFYSVGIEFGTKELHIAVFEKQNTDVVWVKQASLPNEQWPIALKRYVEKENLSNTPCHLALSVGNYQILQIDKPNVSEDEMAQALRWAIKDLLPEQDQLAVDYFDLPKQSAGGNKVNVVAMPYEQIRQICLGVNHSGLKLACIGIEELANCDLLAGHNEAVISLMQETGEDICLNIVKQGQLYFSRRLRGYENLVSLSEQELGMGIADNLSVEIQRSMDYFESQLRQAPVKSLLISLDTPHQQALCELIQQTILIPTSPYTPDIRKADGLEYNQASFTSIAAALAQRQTEGAGQV